MAKLTNSVEVYLDDEMLADVRARAALARCSASELIRDVVCDLLHGCTYGEHVAQHRRKAIERIPPKRRRGDGE